MVGVSEERKREELGGVSQLGKPQAQVKQCEFTR